MQNQGHNIKVQRPEERPKKSKDFKKAIKQLFSFLKPFRVLMILALSFALLGAVLQIFFPLFIGNITEHIAGVLRQPIDTYPYYILGTPIDISMVLRLAIIAGTLALGGIIFSFLQGFIMTTVTQRAVEKMRSRIIKKLNILPLKYFDTTSFGDILARLTSDVDLVGQWLGHLVITLVTSIFLMTGILTMMFIINWIMALSAIGATLIGAFVSVFIMKNSQKYHKRRQKKMGQLSGQIEETYAGHSIVKAYSAGDKIKTEFRKTNQELEKAHGLADFFSIAIHPIMHFIGNLGFVVVCVVGVALITSGNLSGAEGFGVIASFLIFVRLFSQPLMQLAEAGQGIQITAAASERIFEFLDESELDGEEHKTARIENVKGEVEFRNVVFGYDKDKTIIKNFSANITAGSTVAIVGPTGGGKTTLVNLLMRFYEIDSGEILIDGINIKDMKREELASLFGMVLQDTWIFEGTIGENIAYNNFSTHNTRCTTHNERRFNDNIVGATVARQCKYPLESVIGASKMANLDHFIRTLPNGYDTVLDDKTNLSGGQRQLVTIARAFMANKPMLILDEATSSVDTRTEILIQEATDRLTKGRTTFVIAHRLSTIKNADLILVLKDGDIIEKGNHTELLAQNGFYASLYNAQFAKYEG